MIKKYFTYVILLLFTTMCSSAPRFTDERSKNERVYETRRTEDGIRNRVLETVTGVASYYADDFHGNLTANGETYDMHGISAAHPTYPFDTVVRITNLSNGNQVTVRINDRMPERHDRIIDLSLGTAQQLGMIEDGITEIKLEVLEWGGG